VKGTRQMISSFVVIALAFTACETSSTSSDARAEAEARSVALQTAPVTPSKAEDVDAKAPAGPRGEASEDSAKPPEKKGAMPDASRRGLVRVTASHTALVLMPRADATLGKGDAVSIERHTSAYKQADMTKLDPSYEALIGESVVFEGMDGEVCRGKVISLAVHAEATAHYSNRMDWDGTSGAADARKHTDAEVASAIYDMAADGGTSLVALTDAKPADCEGAAWGHHDKVRIVQYQITGYDAAGQFDEELAAFKTLPGYRALQKEWTSARGGKGPWYRAHDENGLRGYRIDGGSMRYTLIQASATPNECDSFEGEFWALYLHTDEELMLLSDGEEPGVLGELRAATDSDGDGVVELITADEIVESDGAKKPVHRVKVRMKKPDFDCAC